MEITHRKRENCTENAPTMFQVTGQDWPLLATIATIATIGHADT